MVKSNRPVDVFKFIDMPTDGNPKPCWPWLAGTGGKDGRGYFSAKGVKWLSYRLVYTLIHGVIPDGQMVRHKCDNKLCCNPYHLELGSQSDNENDKYDRDRYGFPVAVVKRIMDLKQGEVKLTNPAISAIIENEFGLIVSARRVSDIATGKRRAKQSGATT